MQIWRPAAPPLLIALLLGSGIPLFARAEVAEAVARTEAPEAIPDTEEPRKLKLFFHGLTAASGMPAEEVKGLSRYCSTEMTSLGFYEVISDQDIQALLGLESRKQLLGCDEDSSCLAEMAGSLGAERVIYGDLSRYGTTVLMNLTLLDSSTARVIGAISRKIEGAETLEPVIAVVEDALRELAGTDTGALAPKAAPPPRDATPRSRVPGSRSRKARKPDPQPPFQLRTQLRIDGSYTLHSGIQTVGNTETPSADYYGGGVFPYLGLGVRLRKLDLMVAVGWAGKYWKTPVTEYRLENAVVSLRLDVSYDFYLSQKGMRWELGLGGLYRAGPGGHIWIGGEWPLVQRESWGFDLNANFDIEYEDWSGRFPTWKPFGVALILNVGGSLRWAP